MQKRRKIIAYGVTIGELIEKMNLKDAIPEVDVERAVLTHPDVNRPAFQLTGLFDHFDKERVQIIEYMGQAYISSLSQEQRRTVCDKLLAEKIPYLMHSRGQIPGEDMLELCNHYDVPRLVSDKTTSGLMVEVIRWLKVKLAPCIDIHGILVGVSGEGVLTMGENDIGKSEAALEPIKCGHRLVTGDVVGTRKANDETLIGSAPDIAEHSIELRGIGIINVKALFGVESVKDTQAVDMAIKLEDWNWDRECDRLGPENQCTEFFGNKVVCHSIPIRPGKSLAIIVESAAVSYHRRKADYGAVQELYRRIRASLNKKSDLG